MNKLTVLVGLPASGKSTWRSQFVKPTDFVYSPDDFVDMVAKVTNKTYNDVWSETVKEATDFMDMCLKFHVAQGNDVVWDQTNLSLKKRRQILSRFPKKQYSRTAVVFQPPKNYAEWGVLRHRLANRPGKNIPDFVIQNMLDTYVEPTLEEGFDYITYHGIKVDA